MDPENFDKLVARLAAAPTRRNALKGMGLGILSATGGTAAAIALQDDAEGKGKGKKGRKSKKKGGDDNDDVALERKKGANGKCKKNKNCLSNKCQGGKKKKKKGNGRCQPSDVGERCRKDKDCIRSSPCVGGICSFVS